MYFDVIVNFQGGKDKNCLFRLSDLSEPSKPTRLLLFQFAKKNYNRTTEVVEHVFHISQINGETDDKVLTMSDFNEKKPAVIRLKKVNRI